MCLSGSLAVDLMLVNPGLASQDDEMRNKLLKVLMTCEGFPAPCGFVFGPCSTVVKFLVFSYSEALHQLTTDVVKDCFKRLGIVVGPALTSSVSV